MSKPKKVLYIDYLAPMGHVLINNDILKEGSQANQNVNLISTDFYVSKINDQCKKIIFFQIPFRFYFSNYFNIILSLIQVLFIQYKYDHLYFLSFENRLFPIFSFFFAKKTSVVVHNNIDSRLFKRFNLFKFISRSVTFIVFEDYISEYIKNKYGYLNFIKINHPIITDFSKQKVIKKDVIFAPGGGNKYDTLTEEKIMKFINKNNLKLITKVPFTDFQSSNISNISYFENINIFFYSSKWVLINCNYEYRVSGIFYEAIGAGCNVLFCDDSLFLFEMKKKYLDRVFHIDKLNNL
jgi:hypothetical protein